MTLPRLSPEERTALHLKRSIAVACGLALLAGLTDLVASYASGNAFNLQAFALAVTMLVLQVAALGLNKYARALEEEDQPE